MYKENHTPPSVSAPRIRRALTRRRFLQGVGWGVTGLAGYGGLIEANLPFVTPVTVALPNLPPAFDGIRIAAISDLHLQPLFPEWRLRPTLDAVRREKADMIVILGDYVNSLWRKERNQWLDDCAAACSVLTAPQGTYAIFGNHDYEDTGDPPFSPWRAAGIHVLSDDVTEVWRGSDRIFLVGLRSALMRPTSPWSLVAQAPTNAVKIVLWHEPDRAQESAAAGASLQLSGHTHGGQVRLPLAGPILLPALGKLYPAGLYHVRAMPLYVTRGVGVLPPFIRFCCPPEVTLLTLRAV